MVFCLAALLAPGSAAAQTITLGSELIKPLNFTTVLSGPEVTIANPRPEGPNNPGFAPADGQIVRWRLAPQSGTNVYRLTILHPVGDGTYAATATSDPETASSVVNEVFPTALPIVAGDLIGLTVQSSEAQTKVSVYGGGNSQFGWVPFLGIGNPAAAPDAAASIEFAFNADLVPVPEVTLVAPASGPVGGGTAVTIAGRDFAEVSGVSFGSVPASSFVVLSENRIAAVAPPAAGADPVDVTVTNSVGTSAAAPAGRFTYLAPPAPPPPPGPSASTSTPPAAGPSPAPPASRACKVPRLIGKTLPASRRILRRSGCRLGAVRGLRRAGKKVTRQSPRPALARQPGWVVNVTID
jgi:hypothetical protein